MYKGDSTSRSRDYTQIGVGIRDYILNNGGGIRDYTLNK